MIGLLSRRLFAGLSALTGRGRRSRIQTMETNLAAVLYVLAMVVGVDILFFRHQF